MRQRGKSLTCFKFKVCQDPIFKILEYLETKRKDHSYLFPLPRNLLFATVHVSSRFQFLICPSRSFSFFFFPFVQLLVFLPNFKRWSLSFYLFFFYFVGAESFSVSFPFKIDKMATFWGFCSFLLLLNLCVSASCSFSFVGLSCFPFWNWQDGNFLGFLQFSSSSS